MPNEYEFMKSAKEKQMSDEEYKALREQYDKKAEEAAGRVKKTLAVFLVIFCASFVLLHIVGIFNSGANRGAGTGNYTWLAVQFLLAVFLYGLKPEEGRQNEYETDRKILINYTKSRITAYKIRLGLVIGIGVVFVMVNIICWWLVLESLSVPATGYAL
ncbi:MAG: hypothetical protein FWH10_01615 [Oscillospiraceae bacterium]|nr:hypothetical protein [Oscillospiraceae bacterium]